MSNRYVGAWDIQNGSTTNCDMCDDALLKHTAEALPVLNRETDTQMATGVVLSGQFRRLCKTHQKEVLMPAGPDVL